MEPREIIVTLPQDSAKINYGELVAMCYPKRFIASYSVKEEKATRTIHIYVSFESTGRTQGSEAAG